MRRSIIYLGDETPENMRTHVGQLLTGKVPCETCVITLDLPWSFFTRTDRETAGGRFTEIGLRSRFLTRSETAGCYRWEDGDLVRMSADLALSHLRHSENVDIGAQPSTIGISALCNTLDASVLHHYRTFFNTYREADEPPNFERSHSTRLMSVVWRENLGARFDAMMGLEDLIAEWRARSLPTATSGMRPDSILPSHLDVQLLFQAARRPDHVPTHSPCSQTHARWNRLLGLLETLGLLDGDLHSHSTHVSLTKTAQDIVASLPRVWEDRDFVETYSRWDRMGAAKAGREINDRATADFEALAAQGKTP